MTTLRSFAALLNYQVFFFFYGIRWTVFPKLAVPLGSYSLWLFDVLASKGRVSSKGRVRVETLIDRMNWQDNLEAKWQKWYSHIFGLSRQRHFEAKLYYHIIYIIELDDGLMVSADICNKVCKWGRLGETNSSGTLKRTTKWRMNHDLLSSY